MYIGIRVYSIILTFTTLWAYSADNKLMLFFLFFPENRIWHYMQTSPMETIYMKCQILFSMKKKKKKMGKLFQ